MSLKKLKKASHTSASLNWMNAASTLGVCLKLDYRDYQLLISSLRHVKEKATAVQYIVNRDKGYIGRLLD